jgi:hypothetical protein
MTVEEYFEKNPNQDEVDIPLFVEFTKNNVHDFAFTSDNVLVYDLGAYNRYLADKSNLNDKCHCLS